MKLIRIVATIAFALFFSFTVFSQSDHPTDSLESEVQVEFDLSVFEEFPWLNCENPKAYLSNQSNAYLLVYMNEYSGFFNKTLNILEEIQMDFPEVLITIIHTAKYKEQTENEHFLSTVINNGIKFPIVNVTDLEFVKNMDLSFETTAFLYSKTKGTLNYYDGFWELEHLSSDINSILAGDENNPYLNKFTPQKAEIDKISLPICKQMSNIVAAPSFNWLFISMPSQHKIIAIDTYGRVVDYIGTGKKGYKDSSAANAQFNNPKGLAWDDKTNTLYIADTQNNCIRKYTYADEEETDPKLRARVETYIDETTFFIESQEFEVGPEDIFLDGNYMLIAMKGSDEIWKYDVLEETFERYSFAKNENKKINEIAVPVQSPVSITNSTGGSALIYCQGNDRMMNLRDQTLLKSIEFDFDNVPFSNILSNGKQTIALSPLNNQVRLYENNKLKKTLGKKQSGYADGKVKSAKFYEPYDAAFLNGSYYVVDRGNNAIRKINSKFKKVSTIYIEDVSLLIESKIKDSDEIEMSHPELVVHDGSNKIKFKLDLDSKYELVPSSFNVGFDLGPHINEGTFLDLDAEDFNDGIINATIDHGESATYSKLILTMMFREVKAPHNLYYKKVNLQITYDYEDNAGTNHTVVIPMN